MKIRLIKSSRIKDLFSQVSDNLDIYRAGAFDALGNDSSNYYEIEYEIDEAELEKLECSESDSGDLINCQYLFNAMKNLPPYLARDERVWVYLTHTGLMNYTRKRWPIPSDDKRAEQDIKNHFFLAGGRTFERDNAASRLWWMAYLCNRAIGLSMNRALECLLFKSDVRANIIERPTTSQNVHVFSAILKKLNKSFQSDEGLFERDKFRTLMKHINLIGGIKLLGAMDEAFIMQTIEEII